MSVLLNACYFFSGASHSHGSNFSFQSMTHRGTLSSMNVYTSVIMVIHFPSLPWFSHPWASLAAYISFYLCLNACYFFSGASHSHGSNFPFQSMTHRGTLSSMNVYTSVIMVIHFPSLPWFSHPWASLAAYISFYLCLDLSCLRKMPVLRSTTRNCDFSTEIPSFQP